MEEECDSLIECQESNTQSALENSSTVSNEAAHQLDLIDQFDICDEKITFKEYNEVDEELETVKEIHSEVELPELASLDVSKQQIMVVSENKLETDSIEILTSDVETTLMKEGDILLDLGAEVEQEPFEESSSMGETLPDVIDIVESSKSTQADQPIEDMCNEPHEEVVEPSPIIASLDGTTSPETEVQPTMYTQDSKDSQIRLLREILQNIGNLLSVSVGEGSFIVPEELDDSSANEVVSKATSMIAAIRNKAAQAISTTQFVQSTLLSNTTKDDSLTATKIEKESTKDAASIEVKESPKEEEWEEIMEENHPAPDYGLESPVISHLLTTWTTDTSKVRYFCK